MSVTIGWSDIALRLILTAIAGGLIGLNRGEHGRPAGLRTVLLVSLAACISMIQANLLMSTAGRAPDSFIMLDLMRLPLGILTGVGFIGAGAILRKENLVVGVTTAATLWFVTVMGLCFGGGQFLLGIAAFALGMLVLWVLKWVESQLPQDRQATLWVIAGDTGVAEEELRRMAALSGCEIFSVGLVRDNEHKRQELSCEIHWRASAHQNRPPEFLDQLAQLPGVIKLKWSPLGAPATTG
jgi:putative Mg2+ transporter-C (MgtC) family protein